MKVMEPGEILYSKDDIDEQVYFLNNGELEIFFEKNISKNNKSFTVIGKI